MLSVVWTFEFFELLGGNYACRVVPPAGEPWVIQHSRNHSAEAARGLYARKMNECGVPVELALAEFDRFQADRAAYVRETLQRQREVLNGA